MSKSQETRMRLFEALEALLKTRELESIRVSDICRLSGISRTTFYTYFEDIFAVIQWFWDDVCSRSLYLINDGLTWHDGHLKMLRCLVGRRDFFRRAFRKKDYHSLFSYGYRGTLIVHIHNIERRLNRALSEQELFELDYAISALAAMTTKWAEDGMTVPPERMATLFDRCIPPFCRDRPDA